MSSLSVIVNSLGGGGSERQAVLLARGLIDRGWDVRVISLLSRADYADEDLRKRTVFIGRESHRSHTRVNQGIREALLPGVPVLSFNWYPSVHAFLAAGSRTRIIRFGGIPSADGVRGVRRLLAREALRGAAAVVGCSWGVLREVAREIGCPRYACSAIPNGVFYAPSGRDELKPWPRPYILTVGRLEAVKGQDMVIRAFAAVASEVPHDLVVLGSGGLEGELHRLCVTLGVENRVYLLGHRDDLPRWYAHADLLAHAPRWEGFGNVIVEAMARGVPVLVTDAPYGPREILERVPGGVLADMEDVEGFAVKMADLLARPAERDRLGRIGVEGVPCEYSPDRVVGEYERVIRAAVDCCDGRVG